MFDYEIYTDGGYSMQADLGAFAYVILQDGKEIKRFAQKIAHETNNRAEIMAIMESVLSLGRLQSQQKHRFGVQIQETGQEKGLCRRV